MRARSATSTAGAALGLLLALAASSCGGGDAQVQLPTDAGRADATEAPDVEGDVAGDASDTRDAVAEAAAEAGPDAPAETGPSPDGPAPEKGPGPDGPAPDALADKGNKPPATASWTIAPNPMCTAAGAGCMDTGTVGGYQVTASGACPNASSVQLWFPGGASLPSAGNYAVKPAAGILDIINMPAGMVGVLAERDDAAMKHFRSWGRSGTITVSISGAGRRLTFSGLMIRDEVSGALTTLGGDATCP